MLSDGEPAYTAEQLSDTPMSVRGGDASVLSVASGAAGSVDTLYTAATTTSSAAARQKGETYARWIRDRAAGAPLEPERPAYRRPSGDLVRRRRRR